MENAEEYSTENLQKCSYRFLQQTAKAMGLPSNVKKVYLIQLIHARKHYSSQYVENMVKQVCLERHHQALARKRERKRRIQQSSDVSSTSNSKSPPISSTPKRVSHIMIRYSPEQYSPSKPRSHRSYSTVGNKSTKSSTRVLRSFKSLSNPSYVLDNALIDVINKSDSEKNNRSTSRVAVRTEDKQQQVNMKPIVRKQSVGCRSENDIVLVPKQRSKNTTPLSVQRQRRVSGIYPLNEEPNSPIISLRRADGTVAKLTAYIRKPITFKKAEGRESDPNMRTTHSKDKNTWTSKISLTNYKTTTVPNIPQETISYTPASYGNNEDSISLKSNTYKENETDNTVYNHKKIRAEQVRSQHTNETGSVNNECGLPKISEVFSNFNSVYERDVSQPIYVQVNSDAVAGINTACFPSMNRYQTSMLENLYNLKSVYLVNQPLVQVTTTVNTQCVYSTPIITTAKAQPSSNVSNFLNVSSQDNPKSGIEDQQVNNFFKDFRDDEVFSDKATVGLQRSYSADSLQSQELGANVTIPEMVEDALEIISQDGDYMERMGMDIRMQCILCDWAGPRIILEYHIRREHQADILQCNNVGECVARYTLGALAARRVWLSLLLSHRQELYVLSAKYQDPDRFAATLTSLSNEDILTTGSITIYNKVTGEPFTWKGVIEQLPPILPYEYDPDGLNLELSRLELLPNSANLKLMNRELVLNSANKVVVGQPELHSIEISLVVKLFD